MDPLEEPCYLTMLSHELLCHILSFLPLKTVIIIGMLNKKLLSTVKCHLCLLKEIDFCENKVLGYMSQAITDKHLKYLLSLCPNLEVLRGLHSSRLEMKRARKANTLSVQGILEATSACPKLRKIETSNFPLLEAFSNKLKDVELEGIFRNKDGVFPPLPSQYIRLSPFLRLSSLHLIGVQVTELPTMPELLDLHLRWIYFTRLYPFRSFSAPKLKSFVIQECVGPSFPLRYYPVFIALGFAPELTRLEIVRVPILGGMILRAVEEGLRNGGFRKLKKLVIGDCKGIIESDFGQLLIASGESLETVYIQASLTKNSLFAALLHARCCFPNVKWLQLGFINHFPLSEQISEQVLLDMAMTNIPDVPASITDSGLKMASQLFPNVSHITISNCPHIVDAREWVPSGVSHMWKNLESLLVDRCHCLRLPQFASFLSDLEKIEILTLSNMFREPPKGCSHVGLSAGTGLGLSSAIVSNQDEHIAVQGHHVEAVPEIDNPIAGFNEPEVYEENAENFYYEREIVPQPGCSRRGWPRGRNRPPSCCRPTLGRSIYSGARLIRPRSASSPPKQLPTESSDSDSCDDSFSSSSFVSELKKAKARERIRSKSSTKKRKSNIPGFQGRKRSSQSVSGDATTSGDSSRKRRKSTTSRSANGPKNPFIEKDITLVFPVTSESLVCLNIISCGISDVVINNCPNLIFVEVATCRILKEIQFKESHSLANIKVFHCPKIHLENFVAEIMNLYSKNSVLVYLEPHLSEHYTYSLSCFEEYVFPRSNSNHSVVIFHNKNANNDDVIQYRGNFFHWLKFVKQICETIPVINSKRDENASLEAHFSLSDLVSSSVDDEKSTYPWGHHLERIIGNFTVGEYELLTNNPIFSAMWRKFNMEPSENDFFAQELKFDKKAFLNTEVPELIESNIPIGNHHIGFYVNVVGVAPIAES